MSSVLLLVVLNSELRGRRLGPLKAPAARVENFENEASQNQIWGTSRC